MEIRILTPVPQILVENRPVDVGSPKARLVLAVLAESAGRIVSVRALAEHVWGEHPPDSVRPGLHSHISRLRARLRAAGVEVDIVSQGRGYVLEVEPDSVDWHQARKWSNQARKCSRVGRHEEAAELLERALALWRGDPLAALEGPWAEATRRLMVSDRTRLLAQWAQARLETGEHDEVLDRLDDQPAEEQIVYLRMRALSAAGRGTEAIDCYTELRERRRREEGVEPNRATQRLFQELIEAGEEHRVARPVPRERGRVRKVTGGRDTLRADVPHFVGRRKELDLLLARAEVPCETTIVQVISGMAGVGKTTLAVHAATVLRDSFDVRLQLELRGISTQQALFSLLLMLGVPGEQIPSEPEARLALWRERLQERRVLLVLDDAKRGQVGPLIPGTPGSVLLVTSRQILPDLESAQRVRLRSLGQQEAVRMFATFTGHDPDSDGMGRAVVHMRNLPIALRVGAGYLHRHPSWSPAYLADQLAHSGRGVSRTLIRDVAVVFALSYDDLSHQAQRTFLCLGLHPTATVSDHAVAAAVGDWDEMETSIDELLDNHLVEEISPGRYRVHDSLRDFATMRAAEVLSEAERSAIAERILDYYLAALEGADRVALPARHRLERVGPLSTALPLFLGPRDANEWFTDVYPTIEVVLEYARRHGFVEHTARIPLAMAGLLDIGGPWDGAERYLMRAVDAWQEIDESHGLAHALYELGSVRRRLASLESANDLLESAVAFWEREGDDPGVAYARIQLGSVRYAEGDHAGALWFHRAALTAFRAAGDRWGEAQALNHMGRIHHENGDQDTAWSHFMGSVSLSGVSGDRYLEASALKGAAQVSFERGRHREARQMCLRALEIFEELGNRFQAAKTNQNLGIIAHYRLRYEQAHAYFLTSREKFLSMGAAPDVLNNDCGLARTLLALGRVKEAEELLESTLHRVRTVGAVDLAPQVLNLLGDVYAARRRPALARMQYRAARTKAREVSSVLDEGLAWNRLGDLCRSEGDMVAAQADWRRSVELLQSIKSHHLHAILLKLESSMDSGLSGT